MADKKLNQSVIYDGIMYHPGDEDEIPEEVAVELEENGFFDSPEGDPDPYEGYNAQSPFLDTSEEGSVSVTGEAPEAMPESTVPAPKATTTKASTSTPAISSSSSSA